MNRRFALIASLLVALVAGGALAAVLGGGEESPPRPEAAPTAPDRSETGRTDATDRPETLPGATAPTTEHTSAQPEPTASPRDEQGIEQAVADAAAAAEQGSPPPGIEFGDLPGTNELSIDAVRVNGDRGTATLSSGAVVALRRENGRWRIVGVRAP